MSAAIIRKGEQTGELTDQELEVVIGGALNAYIPRIGWESPLNLRVLPPNPCFPLRSS
jgi:hypothetical protein